MKDKKMYAIKDKVSGKYKRGGLTGSFSSNGKLWSLGNLKSHLRLFDGYPRNVKLTDSLRRNYKYAGVDLENCEVVECEIDHKEGASKPLLDFLKEDMGVDVD